MDRDREDNRTSNRISKKRPADVFRKCPACDSPNVFKFDGHMLCGYCDWNSINVEVEIEFAARQNAARKNKLGEVRNFPTRHRESDSDLEQTAIAVAI